MKCLTISESELHTLSFFNGLTSLFVGLSSSCIALAAGIYISFANFDSNSITPDSKALCHLGEPLGFFLGISFAIAAVVSHFFGTSQLKIIKKEMR